MPRVELDPKVAGPLGQSARDTCLLGEQRHVCRGVLRVFLSEAGLFLSAKYCDYFSLAKNHSIFSISARGPLCQARSVRKRMRKVPRVELDPKVAGPLGQ